MEKKTAERSADRAAEVEVAAQVGVGPVASIVLAVLGLAWLVATIVVAHDSVVGNSDDPDFALGAAAFALPNLVAAGLLAGATTGLLATLGAPARLAARISFGRRRPARGSEFGSSGGPATTPVRRLLTGLACGAVLGAILAGLVLYGYGTFARVVAVAVTLAVGCVIGGALAALPRPVLAAGMVATFGTLLVGLVSGFLQPGLVGLFGGRNTLASQASASRWAAYTVAILGGLIAGLAAYWFLRRYGSRAWPWYLLVGALPGLLLFGTELLTRTGGSGLLNVVRDMSEGDRLTVDFAAWSRLRNAMLVTFIGGLAAMIAVGRTLRATDSDEAPPEAGE